MRQAIVTKYHGPRSVNGSRVSATASAGRIFVEWDDALGPDENHAVAARMLAQKFGWHGVWHAGGLPEGKGNVYVVVDASDPKIET